MSVVSLPSLTIDRSLKLQAPALYSLLHLIEGGLLEVLAEIRCTTLKVEGGSVIVEPGGGIIVSDSAWLKFRVLDADTGAPIPGATIVIDGVIAYTDARGEACIELIGGFTYSYSVMKDDYKTVEGTIKLIEDTTLELTMEKAAPAPTIPITPPTIPPEFFTTMLMMILFSSIVSSTLTITTSIMMEMLRPLISRVALTGRRE